MKIVFAFLLLALAACSAPRDPGDSQAAAPAASPMPAPSADLPTPMSESIAMQPSAPQVLRVVGTEPFWGVKVEGDAMTFTTPEDQVGKKLRGERTEIPGGGLDIAGASNEQAFSLKLRPGDCSDGMSDMAFSMTAEFQLGEATYHGCAQAAE